MADNPTPVLQLNRPDTGDAGWGTKWNTNATILEGLFDKSGSGPPTAETVTYLGQQYYDTLNGVWYVGVDVGADTWARFDASGILVPSGKKVQGPAAQTWLSDGTNEMDPFVHVARHTDPTLAGAAGDFLKLFQNVSRTEMADRHVWVELVSTGGEGEPNLIARDTSLDFTGRQGNSHVLVIAKCQTDKVGWTGSNEIYFDLGYDGTPATQDEFAWGTRNLNVANGNTPADQLWLQGFSNTGAPGYPAFRDPILWAYFTGLDASAHSFEFGIYTDDPNQRDEMDVMNIQMLVFDLGLDGT